MGTKFPPVKWVNNYHVSIRRVPPQGSSTDGESKPKIRAKGIVDGRKVSSCEMGYYSLITYAAPNLLSVNSSTNPLFEL